MIKALLFTPPPGVIFAPGGRPAVFARLQTADHRRPASPVQEEQHATAPCHRARILRLSVFEQAAPIAVVCPHRRWGIFLHCWSRVILHVLMRCTA
jgi:hypothetical protein